MKFFPQHYPIDISVGFDDEQNSTEF